MTEREADERRAWWAIQSNRRDLAKRRAEGSISFAHAAEVEEQIRISEQLYRDGLAAMESGR